MIGQDLQTSSNDQFNAGVTGTTANGIGVQGVSTGYSPAVKGTSNGDAVVGVGGFVGVQGTGAVDILAKSTSAGATVFEGQNSVGNTVFSVDGSGTMLVGNGNLITPFSEFPITTTSGFVSNTCCTYDGVQATGPTYGVSAEVGGSSGSDSGVFAMTDHPQAWLYQGYSVYHGKIGFEVADDGTVFATGYGSTSAPRVEQRTARGRSVDTYASQVSQPTLEDFGEGALIDGIASIDIDPTFAAAMDHSASYFVLVTPEGDCRGLYVAQKSGGNFVVREVQGGRSSIAFTYRIVAKPLDAAGGRLGSTTMPRNFGTRVPDQLLHPKVRAPSPTR